MLLHMPRRHEVRTGEIQKHKQDQCAYRMIHTRERAFLWYQMTEYRLQFHRLRLLIFAMTRLGLN